MKVASKLIDLLFELFTLKRTPRQGWRVAGPPVEQDMIASHVMEVAQLSYILGRMEGLEVADAFKCVTLATVHDNPETRLGERDTVSNHYFEPKTSRIDLKVARDQTDLLPKEIGREIFQFIEEANYGESPEAIIVRDADNLEIAIQAKIFHEGGYTIRKNLLERYLDVGRVRTATAKEIMAALRRKRDLTRWLKNLRT